jgi:alanine-synthesizing transaminase
MRFSKRTQWDTEESELSKAHRERLEAGLQIADLTASNPTRCGFDYPPELPSQLTDPAAFDYDPNPRGSLVAREAICRYYESHGIAAMDAERIVLTTSTSEAYSFLFKLLCDPEDEIVVPQPSYPLFDYLADIEMVRIVAAPLVYDHGWQLDMEGLRRAVTHRTRAVVLVHPNNPTGHFTKHREVQELASVCREHGLALIVDEVFLDYAMIEQRVETFAGRDLGIPVFVVSGLSKICGLPQMKAAWIAASGLGIEAAMERLEVIADTFLSMNAPIQRALPVWLDGREYIQAQIRERTSGNLAELDRVLANQAIVARLAVEGGWYAVLRIPALLPGEEMALQLLQRGVWVHPGHFFGMAKSGWLVVSLLGPRDEFSGGVRSLLGYFS